MKPLSAAMKKSLEAATEAAEKNLHLAEEFLKGRAIDLATAERFRLGVVTEEIGGQSSGLVGRLAVPFLGPAGPVYAQYRCIQHSDCGAVHCNKFLGWNPGPIRLFNLRALVEAGSSVHVTEGPLDAIALESMGLHALGVPGGNNKLAPHYSRMFAGFNTVYVHGDGDATGRGFTETWTTELDQAIAVPYPNGEDANSVLVKEGPDGIRRLLDSVS